VNALDVMRYGHDEVLRGFDGLSAGDWARPGVTTRWSPKDTLAHLTSFELLLEDALKSVLGRGPTPLLDGYRADYAGFGDAQVAARAGRTPEAVMREYTEAHERVMRLANELGPERLREPGTIPWYGPGYSLDDLVVYINYAHKREHCGQLKVFRKRG